MTQGGLRRLAEAVKFRREEELDIGIAEACRRGGVGPATWVKIENGEPLSEKMANRVYARVDRALGWVVGSCRAILAGQRPQLADQQPIPPRLRKAFEELLADPVVTDQVKASIRAQLYGHQQSPGSSERTAG